MGPKTKKTPKNAYSFYLDEYVEDERKKGRHISHRIAAEECALLWKDLPEEKKAKYIQLAAFYKETSKQDKENKFTSSGISYAEIERQHKALKKKIEMADSEIKVTISNLDSDLLKTHLFYIIHCNYYCKTEEGVYVPGELAIVEFNLGDGIRRTYHTLINPGPLPLGYAFEAKTTIEDIHGLPFPPFEEGDSDYFGILDKILHFLEPGKLPDGKYPPLYCIENNVKASESILKALSENRTEGGNLFRVFLLHKMFFWLKNKCVEDLDEDNVGFPVMANAESEISKDIFCYVPGISCSFHIASDFKYQNCSLSIVQRYVYVICDHCCQHIGVPLIPGQHCRLNADTDRKESQYRWRKVRKGRSSPTVSEVPECDFDGLSSYGGDFSWKGVEGACSFLHDELESKFSGLEVSSVTSRSSRNTLSASNACTRGLGRGEEAVSDDEDDFVEMLSMGRGMSRR